MFKHDAWVPLHCALLTNIDSRAEEQIERWQGHRGARADSTKKLHCMFTWIQLWRRAARPQSFHSVCQFALRALVQSKG